MESIYLDERQFTVADVGGHRQLRRLLSHAVLDRLPTRIEFQFAAFGRLKKQNKTKQSTLHQRIQSRSH